MAYGRRRSTYRRRGRRGNRALSTRRVFNNKSARAQAGQIHALNKRITRLYKSVRPEVKVVSSLSATDFYLRPGTADVNAVFPGSMIRPTLGTDDYQRIGNIVKMVSPQMFLTAKYAYITGTSSGIPFYNLTGGALGGALRVIAVQSKFADANGPSIYDILEYSPNASFNGIDTLFNLKIPFKTDITSRYNVIYNRVFYMNPDKPILSKRINFKPKNRTLQWDEDSDNQYPRGTIFWFILQGGLEAANNERTDFSQIDVSVSQRLAYTDA